MISSLCAEPFSTRPRHQAFLSKAFPTYFLTRGSQDVRSFLSFLSFLSDCLVVPLLPETDLVQLGAFIPCLRHMRSMLFVSVSLLSSSLFHSSVRLCHQMHAHPVAWISEASVQLGAATHCSRHRYLLPSSTLSHIPVFSSFTPR